MKNVNYKKIAATLILLSVIPFLVAYGPNYGQFGSTLAIGDSAIVFSDTTITIQGVEKAFITTDSLNIDDNLVLEKNGKLGVGTNQPSANIHAYSSTWNSYLFLESTTAEAGIWIGNDQGNNWLIHKDDDSNNNLPNGTLGFDGSGGSGSNFVLALDASNSRVGVNTTTPSEALHVVGTSILGTSSTITNASGNAFLTIDKSGTNLRGHIRYQTGGVNKWYAGVTDSDGGSTGDEYFIGMEAEGTNPAIFIETNRNIGIGESNPQEILHLTTDDPKIRMESSSANMDVTLQMIGDRYWQIQNDGNGSLGTADYLHIYDNTAGASRVVISDVGYVGIGTTAPTELLEVQSSSFRIANFHRENAGGAVVTISNATGAYSVGTNASNNFFIRDSVTTNSMLELEAGSPDGALYLESSGDFGVGTMTPLQKVSINGNLDTKTSHIKTATATLSNAVRNYVIFSSADGAVTITLDNASDMFNASDSLSTEWHIKDVGDAGTNNVTFNCAGTDSIFDTSWSTSTIMTTKGQAIRIKAISPSMFVVE